MIIIIPTLALMRRILELNNATKPYVLLLGEKELASENTEKTDETYFALDICGGHYPQCL